MRPERPHQACRVHCTPRWLRPLRRRWPLLLLFVAALALLTTRFVEMRQLASTLARGHWPWLAASVVLQVVYYGLYAVLFHYSFLTVGIRGRLRELVPALFVSIFVGTVAPGGGVTSAAVLIEDARRRQQSPARTAEGILLAWVAGLGGIVPLLLVALGYLYLRHALQPYQAVGAILFLLYTALLGGILLVAMWQPRRLHRLLRRLQGIVNRLLARMRRPPLPADWAHRNAAESTGAAIAIVRRPIQVARTLGVALAAQLVNLASLYTLFLAFEGLVGLGALVAGLAFGHVFGIISIIPFDLGMVEGVMTLVYTSLGVPAATALVVVLAFRGLNAWLPVAVGFLMFRWILPRSRRGG